MHLTLCVSQFPEPSIGRVAIEGIPSACIAAKSHQVVLGQSMNSTAGFVGNRCPLGCQPLPGQHRFAGFNHF